MQIIYICISIIYHLNITFRIGNIGDVYPEDMEALLLAIREVTA